VKTMLLSAGSVIFASLKTKDKRVRFRHVAVQSYMNFRYVNYLNPKKKYLWRNCFPKNREFILEVLSACFVLNVRVTIILQQYDVIVGVCDFEGS
jgi:hypothetical protein